MNEPKPNEPTGTAVRSSELLAAIVNEHWTHGGTGITNFRKPDRAIYQAAIEAYGDPNILICDKSLPDMMGRTLPYLEETCHSLHCVNGRKDLSDFWRGFDAIRAANAELRHGATERNER